MPRRFIGVDLAWGPRGNAGLCLVADGRVVGSTLARTDEEILAWLRPVVAGPCVVAIDAPLIVTNPTGRRACERAISRCFGKHHAGAHSSNLSMPAFAGGARALRLAKALGLDVDPVFEPRVPVRRAIEVYPHPAIVALFGLDKTLKYKAKPGKSGEERRVAFRGLADALEGLQRAEPPVDVTASPRWASLRSRLQASKSGAELDRLEDELDAYLCAYIALYYWLHGTARCRIVGDVENGYIVTPVTETLARCLDREGDEVRRAGTSS